MASFLPVFGNSTWYRILYPSDGGLICAFDNPGFNPGMTSCTADSPAGSDNYQFLPSSQSDPSKPTFLVRNQWAGPNFYFATKCSVSDCDQNTAAVINPGNTTTIASSALWSFAPADNSSVHIMNVAKPHPFLLVKDGVNDDYIHMSSQNLTGEGVGSWQFEESGSITDTSFLTSANVPKSSSSPSSTGSGAIAAIVLGAVLALLAAGLGVLLCWSWQRRRASKHLAGFGGHSKRVRSWRSSKRDDLAHEPRTQRHDELSELNEQTNHFPIKDTLQTPHSSNALLEADSHGRNGTYRNRNPVELSCKDLSK